MQTHEKMTLIRWLGRRSNYSFLIQNAIFVFFFIFDSLKEQKRVRDSIIFAFRSRIINENSNWKVCLLHTLSWTELNTLLYRCPSQSHFSSDTKLFNLIFFFRKQIFFPTFRFDSLSLESQPRIDSHLIQWSANSFQSLNACNKQEHTMIKSHSVLRLRFSACCCFS